ncbi:MAG: hypothetical protein ACREC6_12200 [Hyphomicrobiaceae bacterium]
MTTSRLTLYNGALRHLKERRLATVSDAVEPRRLLDDAYDGTLAFMLEAGLWNFAKRTVAIEQDPSLAPAFGFSYAFDKPTDFVRLTAISASPTLMPTLDDYVDEPALGAAAWHANVDPLYVGYVSNDAQYGGNLTLWPESFVRAVEFDLAVKVGPHLVSLDGTALAALERQSFRALLRAKSLAAMNEPIKRPPPGRLVKSRSANRGRSA